MSEVNLEAHTMALILIISLLIFMVKGMQQRTSPPLRLASWQLLVSYLAGLQCTATAADDIKQICWSNCLKAASNLPSKFSDHVLSLQVAPCDLLPIRT